ncbi:hypothetical protein AVKW3434_22760 [Acidovorax sp. SUPP3434]|uniref:hypothetical protein n=1 Tax=Acidovorax sp. SUPP3434 TaxID=2920880 RepID=UPI0023DE2E02|nr:hypothetical protein [Acidovorax sp. SUPP3434]GKT02263.1 hypothetical protein AVKW3434_22760 [Acidovorax sp. SUPP3434]
MTEQTLMCRRDGCSKPVEISDPGPMRRFILQLQQLYRASTLAGDNAAQYWADIAVNSRSPWAPLAHVLGAVAVLWTPEIAPTTALTLGTAGYGFAALPKNLIHFTTTAFAAGIARTGVIRASAFPRHGIYGPGVYMARIGRPINLLVAAQARVPIMLATPAGTARILPYLVYVRWGLNGVKVTR